MNAYGHQVVAWLNEVYLWLSNLHLSPNDIFVLFAVVGMITFLLDMIFYFAEKPRLAYACYLVQFVLFASSSIYADVALAALIVGLGFPIRTSTYLMQRDRVARYAA